MIVAILGGVVTTILVPSAIAWVIEKRKSDQRKRKESEIYMTNIRRAFKQAPSNIDIVTLNKQSYAVNFHIKDELITLCVVTDYTYKGEAFSQHIRNVHYQRFELIEDHALEVFELLADFHAQRIHEKLNTVIRPDRLIGNGTRKEELKELFYIYKDELAEAVVKEQRKQEGLLSSTEVENLLETEFPQHPKRREVRPRTAS